MNQPLILNNKAILCLQEGKVFEACKLLSEASRICLETAGRKKKSRHRDHVITWLNIGASDRTDECCEPCLTKLPKSAPRGFYPFVPAVRKPCCQAGPMIVGTVCKQCKDDLDTFPYSVSPVIWYNLAVSCQLVGLQLSEKNKGDGRFYLERSVFFYERVKDAIQADRRVNGLSTLLLAVLNNQACLLHGAGMQTQCALIVEKLRGALQLVAQKSPRYSQHKNWMVFGVNLLILGFAPPAPAA